MVSFQGRIRGGLGRVPADVIENHRSHFVSDFVTVARIEDVEPGAVKQVWVGDTPVALCNLNGEFCAISDICSHEEFYLSGGEIDGDEIECPMHGGVFN